MCIEPKKQIIKPHPRKATNLFPFPSKVSKKRMVTN